jgi:hypothetical protein
MTGDGPISLNADEKAKLKQFAEEGGLIVANLETSNQKVLETFRTLGTELFPGHKFESLSAKNDHVLLTGEQFPVGGQKRPIDVEALSNGARLLMILAPTADLSGVFQRREFTKTSAYEFFANAYLYAVEKTARTVKGESHIVRPDPATQPSTAFTVARLKYNGRWDPEPGGWRRLAAVLHNTADLTLNVRTVTLGNDTLDSVDLAHLTGTDAFTLTEAQRTALKKYIAGGGLLLIDNCGGNDAFDQAVRAELAKVVPDAESQLLAPLKADHALFGDADGQPIAADYRAFALPKMGSNANSFQMRGLNVNDRLAVLYSPQDLSVGLVGQPVDGIIGYTPDTATKLVRRIIELRRDGKL